MEHYFVMSGLELARPSSAECDPITPMFPLRPWRGAFSPQRHPRDVGIRLTQCHSIDPQQFLCPIAGCPAEFTLVKTVRA
jgi:hypothetical protein